MFQNLRVYKILCIFRVVLLLFPQLGYVHPDEYFQGPEIVYGDIPGYKVYRTWEFTSSEPIRSIFYPYSITIIPALIVQLLMWLEYEIGSYLLLILPRLIMCVLSFLQDICIYHICITIETNYKPSLILFASSYVTIVYFTRTFSNSLESILFAFFLLLLFRSLNLYKKMINCSSHVLSRQFVFCSFLSGITLSLGIFNRPTFICFSIFPMVVWLFLFYKVDIYTKINIFISFLLGVFSMVICLVSIDTFYYNKINFHSISDIKLLITPLNFIVYNLNSSNLYHHGLHPRWLHVFVNIPLLFSIYGVILLFYCIKKMYNLFYKLEVNSSLLLLLSFITPLMLLSAIPHQEPRFLIPLIIPLSVIYGGPYFRIYISKKACFFMWISSNMFMIIFYGFLHQAGVYLSIHHLNNKIDNCSLIFYKTYMPPRYLLSLKESKEDISIYDFAGIKFDEFEYKIQNIITNSNVSKVIIVLPYKVLNGDFTFEVLTVNGFKFTERVDLFPHLSTENLPNFTHAWHILLKNHTFESILYDLKEIFSIQIMTFER